jgi:hypothetical protein
MMPPEACCFSAETHLPEEGQHEETQTRTGFAHAWGAGHDDRLLPMRRGRLEDGVADWKV